MPPLLLLKISPTFCIVWWDPNEDHIPYVLHFPTTIFLT
jgi:hypothetical protein